MKRLISTFFLLVLFALPLSLYATYGLTQSVLLTASNSERLEANDSATLSPSGDYTAEVWLKFTSLPSDGNQTVVYSHDTNTGNQRGTWIRFQNVSGTYKFEMGISSTGANRAVTTVNYTPTTDTWNHYAFEYDASAGQFELFVDYVSQGTGTGLNTSLFNSTAPFTLGAVLDSGSYFQFFDGQMSLFRFWDGELRSASNLSDNACLVLGTTTNLSAEWTLDNDLTDNSGNSNTLTAYNTPSYPSDVPSACTSGGGEEVSNSQGWLIGI